MSLIIQAKRAAKDNGLYKGEIESLNWEPSHVVMWSRLCDRYGGIFTNEPVRTHQSRTFLEFIDKYKDPEYTVSNNSEQSTNDAKLAGGRNLKDFIPDRQPINTSLPENISKLDAKKELQNRDNEVNKNANIQLPPSMQPPKQNRSVPNPQKVVEQENANNTAKAPISTIENSRTSTQNITPSSVDKGTINETGEIGKPVSNASGTNTNKGTNESNNINSSLRESKETTPSTNSPNSTGKAAPKPGASTAAPAGSTVKVR